MSTPLPRIARGLRLRAFMGAALALASLAAHAQTVSGTAYDSRVRSVVPGTTVTFALDGPCEAYDPAVNVENYAAYGSYDAEGNPRMRVDATGAYRFRLLNLPSGASSCAFRLDLAAPPGYLAPSAALPAAGLLATPPGANYAVQPQASPPSAGQATTYHLRLLLGPGRANVLNNHLPVDPAFALPEPPPPPVGATGLRITKTASQQSAEIGDAVEYRIAVTAAGSALTALHVRDTLPAGFRFIPGTFRVAGVRQPNPAGSPGPVLDFRLPAPAGGGTVNFTYRLRVGAGAQEGNGTNRARAFADSAAGPLASDEARYTIRVEGGVFTTDGCVAGRIFVDCNGNALQDPGEPGIPGVRLYFDDGFFLVSDVAGRYAVCDRESRTHVLKVDPSTLPEGAALAVTGSRNAGDPGSLFVDIRGGNLQRADFAEATCSRAVLDAVKARREAAHLRGSAMPAARPGSSSEGSAR